MRAELLAITFRIFRAGQEDDTVKDIDPAVVSRVVDAARAGLPTHWPTGLDLTTIKAPAFTVKTEGDGSCEGRIKRNASQKNNSRRRMATTAACHKIALYEWRPGIAVSSQRTNQK